METSKINTVIFDLGGVLVDWNPEYLYRKIFEGDTEKMKWFLNTVCTNDWNMEQDAGRSFQKGAELLVQEYPEYKKEIFAFHERWEEMLKTEITDTVLILNSLKSLNKVKLYALTNWSSKTFPIAQKRFEFLNQFEGIVVSGEEKTRKPFTKIYNILLERYELTPENCVFIDDNLDNIEASKQLGIISIHYKNSQQLASDLSQLGLLS